MKFIDSYKRLEKLCSEVYGDNHGVSAYIDEMVKKSDGAYCVSGWNEDLKQLKHYRWVRNQIVHDPNCSEENMCTPEDSQWINDFHSRIMSANDPLAQYRKAICVSHLISGIFGKCGGWSLIGFMHLIVSR